MVTVVRTDGTIEKFDCQRIIDAVSRETELSEELFGVPKATIEQATYIAEKVESIVKGMKQHSVTSHMVRELMCTVMLWSTDLPSYTEYWYRVCTRVGMSVYDAWQIDHGDGFEAHDNANLRGNAETSHKKKADKLSKEQNLLLLPPRMAALHNSGNLHIHDLEYFGTRPFCADSDLRYLFYYGLIPSGDSSTSAVARPANNAEVAILHAVKWLGSAQTNFAGGQGFYNFLTFLAPYLEDKEYEEIYQLMQMFVYEMMQMYCARGGQVVFSSVQLSPGVPEIWRDKPAVYRGEVHDDLPYYYFEREVRLAFLALMEVMLKGDAQGKPFSFPKPEIAIEPCFVEPDKLMKNFDARHPELPTYDQLYRKAFELAAKFGTPYFDNVLPAYRGAGKGISCYQCCAYQFSSTIEDDPEFEDKLFFRNGKHFSMGSWAVVTVNCVRAAYNARITHIQGERSLEEEFTDQLKMVMSDAIEIFEVKQKWMRKLIDDGRIPFACQTPIDPNDKSLHAPPAIDLDSYVYTIGVIGIDDAVKVLTGKRMNEDVNSLQLGLNIIIEMKKYVTYLSEISKLKIALARTPAETTGQRFAMCDLRNRWYKTLAMKTVHGDLGYSLEHISEPDLPVYYTNGTHLAPDSGIEITEKLRIESKFFPVLDGGNIAHIWLGERNPDPEGLYEFGMNLAKNTQTGYFAFTRDFTVCRSCGSTSPGICKNCEKCESDDIDYMSRITGYLSNVSAWNAGKRQELKDRVRVNL